MSVKKIFLKTNYQKDEATYESIDNQISLIDLLLSNDASFLSQIEMMPPTARNNHNTIVFKPNLPTQSAVVHCQNYRHLTKSAYRSLNYSFCEIKRESCFSIANRWKLFLNIVMNTIQKVAPGQGQPSKPQK